MQDPELEALGSAVAHQVLVGTSRSVGSRYPPLKEAHCETSSAGKLDQLHAENAKTGEDQLSTRTASSVPRTCSSQDDDAPLHGTPELDNRDGMFEDARARVWQLTAIDDEWREANSQVYDTVVLEAEALRLREAVAGIRRRTDSVQTEMDQAVLECRQLEEQLHCCAAVHHQRECDAASGWRKAALAAEEAEECRARSAEADSCFASQQLSGQHVEIVEELRREVRLKASTIVVLAHRCHAAEVELASLENCRDSGSASSRDEQFSVAQEELVREAAAAVEVLQKQLAAVRRRRHDEVLRLSIELQRQHYLSADARPCVQTSCQSPAQGNNRSLAVERHTHA